ncbi:phosphotransferase family protein [Cellulomonas endophytica]|uniref:phosphotransferase family protein n=1 Tax=Cellulomonas endophytica TaxID=2494735 RepID=UPI0013E95F15|nr:aminoglycoside phosphotransferase family protein [Cellulomonas endophytica]
MAVAPVVLRRVLDDLDASPATRDHGPWSADGWAPGVQGAVGHVVGVADASGAAAVLKVYLAAASPGCATEVRALALLAEVPGLLVPRVLAHGAVADPSVAGWLLMTRLPGVRWADRRRDLDAGGTTRLGEEVARLLRRVHQVPGATFGPLAGGGGVWPTAVEHLAAETALALEGFAATGGSEHLVRAVARRMKALEPAIATTGPPVLRHGDVTDANVLVTEARHPAVVGFVDLERASWSDPLADVAQLRTHVRSHTPDDLPTISAAYGVTTDAEHERVTAHELLHTVRERTWIAFDRPHGWRASLDRLDALLAASA